ncbi:hypothetical protein PSTG_09539 [Puccinia striiformis f. sp. tritici PST-78]|uniref:Uncharacterized protein n=2 Tax=Puccinia striiformis f. sp. tritici TaxID=168172 RepID=A0A0L0VCT7_9BASI|nr:hypothetical protein PSTG_09539 [Puccinia striiformis f. sp. tritici PST-78]
MERATDLKALTLGITSAPSPSTFLVHPITNFSNSVIPPMNPPQGSAYTKHLSLPMVSRYFPGFEDLTRFFNSAATYTAMVDWTLDPTPCAFNPSGGPPNPPPDNSQVPIILRYSVHTLATLKPRNMIELIDEAAIEFHLDPRSIFLAILINQCPVKISASLYQRIAPLSTIHVQLNSPCTIFNPLPGFPEPILCADPPTNSSTNTSATTAISTASSSSSSNQHHAEQAINDIFNGIAAVPTEPSVAQSPPITNPSSATEIPLGGSSPSAVVDLLPSPISNTSSKPAKGENTTPKPPLSTTSTTKAAGTPVAAAVPTVANGTNNQTTANKPSKKRFLINSLATTNNGNQYHSHHQHRQSHGQEQDSHQARRAKFPFLAKRQSSVSSPTSSVGVIPSSAVSIADSPPEDSARLSGVGLPSSYDPSHELFSMDLFNNLNPS